MHCNSRSSRGLAAGQGSVSTSRMASAVLQFRNACWVNSTLRRIRLRQNMLVIVMRIVRRVSRWGLVGVWL